MILLIRNESSRKDNLSQSDESKFEYSLTKSKFPQGGETKCSLTVLQNKIIFSEIPVEN